MEEKAEAERNAFEALERDFQEVLQELVGDKSLEHFRVEYEKLHRALKKSHESEKRLIKKCRELNQEIVSNASKVQTALKLSQEDQGTIANLKKEIERAWTMVEASHEKEVTAKQTIQLLKVEINNLTRLVEQGAGISMNQENSMNNLMAQNKELSLQQAQLQESVEKYNVDISTMVDLVDKLEGEKSLGTMDLQNMKDLLTTKQTEAERELRRKDRLAKEVLDLEASLNLHIQAWNVENERLQECNDRRNNIEQQYKEQCRILEKLGAQEQSLRDDLLILKSVHGAEQDNQNDLKDKNQKLAQEIALLTDEIRATQLEKTKISKQCDHVTRLVSLNDDRKFDIVNQRNEIQEEFRTLKPQIEMLRKQAQADAAQVKELFYERDQLNKSLIETDEHTKTEMEKAKKHDQAKQPLLVELEKWKLALSQASKHLHMLDKQREKSGVELSSAKARLAASQEELKKRENKAAELKKKLNDVKYKLQVQKQEYEEVRTDRNLYSKNLIESQDEISEMKRKFKIMYHQIEQLKEEIKEKDEALQKEYFEHEKVKRNCLKMKDALSKARKKQQLLQTTGETQNAEIKELESSIQDAEQQRQAQKREYEGVITERDVLGTQLVRRNDELALLYEKIKIQQMAAQKGELAYQERCEEIRGAQIKIKDTVRQLRIQRSRLETLGDSKRKIYFLQRELLGERTKVKALSEELENPMNVHRWRKLEGADPAQYEMVQKVKTLQKRLIRKIEESVEKDLCLQDKEKLYIELQGILAKQPGPEVSEAVSMLQHVLKDKTKKMKATAAELNMYHAQVNDYKDDIERLTRDLQETKRKYFDQKRRNQLLSGTTDRENIQKS